jgi:hypothetical protein
MNRRPAAVHNAAITALSRGQVGNATSALSHVYAMQWGKLFGE